jgi:hypothetical protein
MLEAAGGGQVEGHALLDLSVPYEEESLNSNFVGCVGSSTPRWLVDGCLKIDGNRNRDDDHSDSDVVAVCSMKCSLVSCSACCRNEAAVLRPLHPPRTR